MDDIWTFFRIGLLRILNYHIPSKTSSSSFTQPWISKKTGCLSCCKVRAYRKAKFSNNIEDLAKYKYFKAETQSSSGLHPRHCQPGPYFKIEAFYSYESVKSKREETSDISPLLNKDGFLHSPSTSKTEIQAS